MKATQRRGKKSHSPPPHIWWRANSVLSGCATDVVDVRCAVTTCESRGERRRGEKRKMLAPPSCLQPSALHMVVGTLKAFDAHTHTHTHAPSF